MPIFEASTVFPRPIEEVFTFFRDPANLVRISPPELHMHLVEGPPLIERLARGAQGAASGHPAARGQRNHRLRPARHLHRHAGRGAVRQVGPHALPRSRAGRDARQRSRRIRATRGSAGAGGQAVAHRARFEMDFRVPDAEIDGIARLAAASQSRALANARLREPPLNGRQSGSGGLVGNSVLVLRLTSWLSGLFSGNRRMKRLPLPGDSGRGCRRRARAGSCG